MEVKLNSLGLEIPYWGIFTSSTPISEDTKPFILKLGDESSIGKTNKVQMIYTSNTKEEYLNTLEWFNDQKNYIESLSYVDKLFILSYTFHGDGIANSWVRGRFNTQRMRQMFDDDNDHLDFMPLAPAFYEMIRNTTDVNDIVNVSLNIRTRKYSPSWNELFTEEDEDEDTYGQHENLNVFFKNTKELQDEIFIDLNIIKTEEFNLEVYKSICRLEAFYTDQFIENTVKYYTNKLDNLIRNAPPLTRDIHVYRGIKSAFIPTKEGEKQTVDFISTSLSFPKATKFMEDKTCCIKHMLLKKGTKCLYLGEFSFVLNENEILLPPNTTFKILNKEANIKDYIYYKPKRLREGGFEFIEVKNRYKVYYCEVNN